MMQVKEVELEFREGGVRVKGMKGVWVRHKHFTHTTDKTLFWAELGILYAGG